MKVKTLPQFSFVIGNTSDGKDVVATNDGILVDGEVVNGYDADVDDVADFIDIIDDAIFECHALSDEDRQELGTYLGAWIDIKNWWNENVSD